MDESVVGEDRSRSFDRRTLIKAGAWSVPVLVLATASPAVAASAGTVTAVGSSVSAGFARRDLQGTFTSTYASSVTLTFVSDSKPINVLWVNSPVTTLTIPAGTSGPTTLARATGFNPIGSDTITLVYSTPDNELVTITIVVS